jgi:hypothetical protein
MEHKLCNLLYNYLNKELFFRENEIDKLIEKLLIYKKNKSIISLLLRYYIYTNNNDEINNLINNHVLMKRDYLNLIKYYYNDNIKKSEEYLIYICKIYPLENKDINFIFTHKLFKLVYLLDSVFVQVEDNDNDFEFIEDTSNLKLYYVSDEFNNIILSNIENLFSHNIKILLNKYWIQYNNKLKDINVIIDGGNILHSNKGNINLENLENIITHTILHIGRPILIIHVKHIKNINTLLPIIIKLNILYFLCPFKYNDDIFILWFFTKMNTKPYIISNDKFIDHNKLFINNFNHILNQQTINYNFNNLLVFNKIPKYSNCIQVLDNIYVPHISNKFIKL